MVISDTYLLIILLIWLLTSVYLSNTYFYEHYHFFLSSFSSQKRVTSTSDPTRAHVCVCCVCALFRVRDSLKRILHKVVFFFLTTCTDRQKKIQNVVTSLERNFCTLCNVLSSNINRLPCMTHAKPKLRTPIKISETIPRHLSSAQTVSIGGVRLWLWLRRCL